MHARLDGRGRADGHALHREWAHMGVEGDRTWVALEKDTGVVKLSY